MPNRSSASGSFLMKISPDPAKRSACSIVDGAQPAFLIFATMSSITGAISVAAISYVPNDEPRFGNFMSWKFVAPETIGNSTGQRFRGHSFTRSFGRTVVNWSSGFRPLSSSRKMRWEPPSSSGRRRSSEVSLPAAWADGKSFSTDDRTSESGCSDMEIFIVMS